ncbi:hypothetical protein BYT27DRAFT_7250451 [Phlegmacium glaucopus]|nr:hypothetical protein BYT27DRAFT_7250451 [Phlegmacium glaucopus]
MLSVRSLSLPVCLSTRDDSSFAAGPSELDPSGSKSSESTLSSDQPSSSNSGDHQTQSSSFTKSSDPSPENEHLRLITELELLVEQFRKGSTTKSEAISSIFRILGENSNVTGSKHQKETTFNSYLSKIISFQQPISERSRTESQQSLPKELIPIHKQGEKRPSQDQDKNKFGEEEDKQLKRQKLFETDMPWFDSNNESTSNLIHPSSQETHWLLRIYHGDIAKSKFYVKIALNSPSGIPSSQWEQIFKGDSVNLNQILASLPYCR